MDRSAKNIWFLILLLVGRCFGTLGDIELSQDGAKVIWNNNSKTFSISASSSMSESVDYIWPTADAVSGGQALLSDSAGVLSWGTPTTAAAHALMSGTHSDTTNSTPPARGSIIYGNSTPVWDELVLGAATTFLKSDGTDAGWDAIDLGTDTTGNYVASITDGLAIDGGDGGSEGAAITIAFDPTELSGNRTWGDGSTDTIVWTWDRATGTDPSFTFGDDVISTNNFTADTDIYADDDIEAGDNIIASGGGEATPSHTFTGDLDTGMWSSDVNILNFSIAGTEILEIDSAEITFGANIVSDTTLTDDLGTSSVYWNNLYINDIYKSGRFIPNDRGISSYLLAAYWPFDGDAEDYSGNGNDGTITGPNTVDGKFGAAIDFDANVPTTIIVSDDDSLDMNNITVSAWIKTTATDQDIIRKWESSGNQRSWTLNLDSSRRPVFSITTDGTTGTIGSGIGTVLVNGQWHHVVGTHDGTTVRIYVDGILDDTDTEIGTVFKSTSDIKFADDFIRNNDFDGQLDEVMIFSRVLDANEIKSFYEANKEYRHERLFPVWDDLPPSPIIAARLGATAPTLATFVTDIQQYTFDATNDYVIGATEITHGWKEGTIIIPHIHWATNGLEGTAKGVQWQLKFTVGDTAEAFSAQVTSVVDVTIDASTPDRTHYMSDFGTTIDGSNLRINSYICWRLDRIATAHGNGEPAADPFGLAVGFHAEMDTPGSFTASAK